MPYIRTNDIITYYEVYGEGYPLEAIRLLYMISGALGEQVGLRQGSIL
mgnify:CR=1 FL=1